MNVLGSFFIGDAHYMRVRQATGSPDQPSTSPPLSPSSSRFFHQASASSSLSPEAALELRIRWLEAIVKGVGTLSSSTVRDEEDDASGNKAEATTAEAKSLLRKVEDIQSKLDAVTSQNESLKLFMQYYDSHSRFLNPSFALNDPAAPSHELQTGYMTPSEFEAFLKDVEPDVKVAERDLREIEALDKRGVTGAGNLGVHEELQPRLEELVTRFREDSTKAEELQRRVAALLQRYTTRVDALSELFVEWNAVITDAEDRLEKLEKEKAERGKMGYE